MPTAYPDGNDDFRVTSLPEDTPLSQAGPGGTRNLVESVRDIGDAVEGLQVHASQKTHDHSGVTGDVKKGGKLKQTNTHEEPDTDVSATSLHHTLGLAAGQALPGNYVTDYADGSRVINRPLVKCLSSARPGLPTKGDHIYETDTDRMRLWGSFGNTQIVQGLNSTENYNQGASNTVPAELWDLSYDIASPANGAVGTPNGTHLSWTDGGNAYNRAKMRRKGADSVTQTDDQVLTWQNGPQQIEQVIWFTSPASNDKYFRMSADGQSYWRVIIAYDYVFVNYTTTGRTGEKELGRVAAYVNYANAIYRAELRDRTLNIYFMGELLATIVDRDAVSNKGPNYRGWGTGMASGQRGFGQTTPGNEDWIRIQDLDYYTATNRWTLSPASPKIPVVRLRQNAAQKLNANGTFIEWGEELEDEFDFFQINGSKTDITIKEPGLYDAKVAIQWDPSLVPDTAMVILCINGIETGIRKQQFMRGQGFSPGFSQTLDLSGQIRFATNDALTVKVRYVASGGLLGFIFSWFDQPSRVQSRLDLTYVRV